MNLSEIKRIATQRQLFKDGVSVSKILYEAQVAHIGWETDNNIWVVLLSDETKAILGTNHGSLCNVSSVEIGEYIETTSELLAGLHQCLKEKA